MVMTTSCSAQNRRRGTVLLPVIGTMTLIVLFIGVALISYMMHLIEAEQNGSSYSYKTIPPSLYRKPLPPSYRRGLPLD